MTSIAARWQAVNQRVAVACERAGRSPTSVVVVAVSKNHPASSVAEAAAVGARDFGENYVQELVGKQAALPAELRWHYIGRLQRNKVKQVVGRVVLIHAVDSLELAGEIDRRAAAAGVVQAVLLAVNLAGEATKGGVAAAALANLLAGCRALDHVRVDGLMTMPPPAADPEAMRPYFRSLARLRDELATGGVPLPQLSMGMSGDFEVAIAEGATQLRIGTAIFGERPQQ